MADVTQGDVNTELDDIIQRFFNTLDKHSELHNSLTGEMEEGFFMMSRSRYKMGVKAIDVGRFDAEKLAAIYRVESDDDLRLVKTRAKNPDNCESNDAKGEQTIRRRATNNDASAVSGHDEITDVSKGLDRVKISRDEDVDSGIKKSASHTSVLTTNDPLNCFGILVPQSLRDCQSRFVNAVRLSVDIANTRAELGRLQRRYHTLHAQLQL